MWCGWTSASCARSPTHLDAIAAGISSQEAPVPATASMSSRFWRHESAGGKKRGPATRDWGLGDGSGLRVRDGRVVGPVRAGRHARSGIRSRGVGREERARRDRSDGETAAAGANRASSRSSRTGFALRSTTVYASSRPTSRSTTRSPSAATARSMRLSPSAAGRRSIRPKPSISTRRIRPRTFSTTSTRRLARACPFRGRSSRSSPFRRPRAPAARRPASASSISPRCTRRPALPIAG